MKANTGATEIAKKTAPKPKEKSSIDLSKEREIKVLKSRIDQATKQAEEAQATLDTYNVMLSALENS